MIEVHSTKAYLHLPCGHSQHFDFEPDGSPGECASIHGYDRSVKFTFSGEVDEWGWIIPFGELREVKNFLEYYFDHVTLFGANDPRLDQITDEMMEHGGILGTMRVLPYGVSMEMSSLFVWEHVNPFIYKTSGGRAYVSKVEMIEHERNSAFITVDHDIAKFQALEYNRENQYNLPLHREWDYISPRAILDRINKKCK